LKRTTIILLLLAVITSSYAEKRDSLEWRRKVYNMKYRIDIPLTAVAMATDYWGFTTVDKKPPLDSLTIISLDPRNINWLDRSATRQDAEFAHGSRKISDVTLAFSLTLPFFLFTDKTIRQDWGDLILLYLETQAIVGNLYSWGCVVHVDRIRPLVYNPEVAWEERAGTRTKNAFYSGHTSHSASASFFAAKVFCDYHPELGNKKYLFYGLAAIPPVVTGFFRYKGLKHFPTDIMTGLAVGASTGILVPYIHKRTSSNLTIVPFAGQVNGMALSYRF
jgi:membrane-associated phospholipid phosphatase